VGNCRSVTQCSRQLNFAPKAKISRARIGLWARMWSSMLARLSRLLSTIEADSAVNSICKRSALHTRPGHLCNGAVTPAETVLAFHLALDRRDGSAFDLVAEDLVQHAAGPQGREGLRQTLAVLDRDLGHPTATIHRVVAQDDLVVVHLTMHGHHVASSMPLLAGLLATANAITWDFIHIWRVADGSIVEHWACRDDVGLLAQVGGWPPARSSGSEVAGGSG
jgi:predicted ester cyclase